VLYYLTSLPMPRGNLSSRIPISPVSLHRISLDKLWLPCGHCIPSHYFSTIRRLLVLFQQKITSVAVLSDRTRSSNFKVRFIRLGKDRKASLNSSMMLICICGPWLSGRLFITSADNPIELPTQKSSFELVQDVNHWAKQCP